jgi:hypothetical protein
MEGNDAINRIGLVTEMPGSARAIRHRGLLECCIHHLRHAKQLTTTGSTTQCHGCEAEMTVDGAGAWTLVSTINPASSNWHRSGQE